MSEVWPYDLKAKRISTTEAIRPFKCLILTPFDKQFDQVCEVIKRVVEETSKSFPQIGNDLPDIKRVDWITSSGVIQNEIWKEIDEADLIFCNITGFNPNVMFESGICAAWKKTDKVVFIKDGFFKQEIAFNISPIRYTEYEMTTNGIRDFADKVNKLTVDALISFPDCEGDTPKIITPLELDFKGNRDNNIIYTPPFAHRRIVNDKLEFGSILVFSHSWASIGKEKYKNFNLEFEAEFSNIGIEKKYSFIGVGLRSQHFFANYAHIFYLKADGGIIITEPDENPPNFYSDNTLRTATPLDLNKSYKFKVMFNEEKLCLEVDGFMREFEVAKMKKVFKDGLIRFQSYGCWMLIKYIKLIV